MTFLASRRPRRAVAGLLMFAGAVGAASATLSLPSSAESPSLPVKVTASPLTGLQDGDTVMIHVDATAAANGGVASQIFGAEARICKASAVIDFSADFNPTQTGNCVLNPLSAGSDTKTQVATAPPNLSADLSFKVGVGSDTYETQSGDAVTIDCGPGKPCKIVVKLQVPGDTKFTSFPLSYEGDVVPVDGDLFHPLAPVRILDSRPAPETVGDFATPWTAGLTRDLTVAGAHGVPADADAVVVNATVTGTTADSFLTVWPKGQTKPTASNLNWGAGQTIPNAVTVKVGADGKVSIFNNSGQANVIFDVVGYYDKAAGGAGFTSLAPVRVLDSRPAPETVGPYATPWTAGLTRDVVVAGAQGVPGTATAVVLNATVTGTTASSHLAIWPKGQTKPTASNLNWAAGQTIPNAVTAKVGADGKVSVFNNSGQVNVIFDVVGYFEVGTGDRFFPIAPVRIQDSRPAPETVGAYATPWTAGLTRDVVVSGTLGIPADASAVLLNATVTTTTAESFLAVWPKGQAKPTASSLNWKAGVTIANAVSAKVGTGNKVSVFNNSGTTNVIADAAGYYKPPTA